MVRICRYPRKSIQSWPTNRKERMKDPCMELSLHAVEYRPV